MHLVSAYEGMKNREDQIHAGGKPRIQEALEAWVQLYEETGRPDQVACWTKKLAEIELAVR
jgi:hypothetical protein